MGKVAAHSSDIKNLPLVDVIAEAVTRKLLRACVHTIQHMHLLRASVGARLLTTSCCWVFEFGERFVLGPIDAFRVVVKRIYIYIYIPPRSPI